MSKIFRGFAGTVFLLVLSFLFTAASLAQDKMTAQSSPKMEQPPIAGTENIEAESFLIATVNIYDAAITKQDGRTISTSFLLANREGAQPNLVYGAELLKLGDNDMPVDLVDTFLSPEKIALRANENLPRTFTFTIPPTVEDGEYLVAPIAGNASGMSLAMGQAGKITLQGGSPVPISPKDCFLHIRDEKSDQKYATDQGVDIGSDETLELSCSMKNISQGMMTFSPKFTTYRRNILSGIQAPVQEIPRESTALQPNEEKIVTVTLPKADLPQAYDIDTVFVDQSGTPVSRDIIIHYVLRGASGTLQNILLDKDSYRAGETATATVTFSGSADAFPDARSGSDTGTDFGAMNLEVTLQSGDGQDCSVPRTETFFSGKDSPQQKLSIAVTKDCQYPTLRVRLMKTSDGALLDQVSASLAPVGARPAMPDRQDDASTWFSQWSFASIPSIAVMAVLAGLLVLLGIKLYRSRKGMYLGIFIFSLLVAGFGGGEVARADTIYLPGDNGFYVNYNLNRPSFSTGDTMVATVSGYFIFSCNNRGANLDIYVSPNQSVGTSFMNDSDGIYMGRNLTYRSGAPYFSSGSFAVPASGWTTPGAYATFRVVDTMHKNGHWQQTQVRMRYIGYSLTLAPVDGVCGSANGSASSSAPASSLCSAGTPTAVAGPGAGPVGSWNWTCSGSGGGSNAVCTASYIDLKICENSCDSGLDRTNQNFSVVGGSTRTLKACYNSAVSCTDASGDVTNSALWNDTNNPNNVISFPSKGLLTAAATVGDENFTVSYSSISKNSRANVTCVPLTCSAAKSITDTYCPEESRDTGVSDGCSGTLTCSGTRTYCDRNYHEVSP